MIYIIKNSLSKIGKSFCLVEWVYDNQQKRKGYARLPSFRFAVIKNSPLCLK